jgi:hypothetical protein
MSRHSSIDPDSFEGVWGYCAIVGTRELMWSGHRIPSPASLPELDDYVAALSRGLSLASPLSAKVFTDGAISWLAGELVEGTYRQVNGDADTAEERSVGLMAAALSRIAGERFFIIMLERNRARLSLRATVEAVAVDSPEDARDYILHHPRILTLEAEGLRRLQLSHSAAGSAVESVGLTCERLHGPLN